MSTKKLRKWSLWILICTVFVLFGCGSQLNTPSDVILDTNSPSNPASNENQKDSDIYEEYSKLERAYMEKHYNGVMPSLVSLHSILNRIVDANLPLTKFSALILDIERSKDGLEYTLKIDKVELNDKFVVSSILTSLL
ncbi:MAG: hypothetical protein GX352_10025 [Clostridiales bacterium]|nr:hypothetical protein [Clostridiales bacterium]